MKIKMRQLAISILFATAASALAAEMEVSVVGNVGVTTQSKTLEAPFWNEKITAAKVPA